MAQIRILPESLANKIAAGEVVERPASVVKELVENSLDAGARSVSIEVESGGKRLIRVADDGSGMSHDDALLAFERHATSKLRTAEDLLAIATLGFRGEALPSIAAVARVVLETRAASEASGTRVEIAGGKLGSVKEAGLPVGTTVTVRDLFFNIPARRKFLKSETTELGHIASVSTHYALAQPDRSFRLKTPSQTILEVTAVSNNQERVFQVFGRQVLEELVEIRVTEAPIVTYGWEGESAREEKDRAGGVARIRGFVSRPEIAKSNRTSIFIFVNKRLIRDRLILHAIGEAYRNILPTNAFPMVLAFLELPLEEVDVNVHPSKTEVRFQHQGFVHDFVREAIRKALSVARPTAAFPAAKAAAASARATTAKEAAARFAVQAPPIGAVPLESGELGEALELEPERPTPQPQKLSFDAGGAPPIEFVPAPGTEEVLLTPGAREVFLKERAVGVEDLRPLGQLANSFIVAANASGLWIVDQHVAHERILFEQHRRARLAGNVPGQRLLTPILAELTPRQQAILEQISAELTANGFELEPFGTRTIAVKTAPAGIAAEDVERMLFEILEGVEREAQAISLEALQGKIAASTACHAAIKVNVPLDEKKMRWLLAELAKTEHPSTCPHGRPIVLQYSLREIQRAFRRI